MSHATDGLASIEPGARKWIEDMMSRYEAGIRADERARCAEIARQEARAISKGTFGRLGSTEAIGEHIAKQIIEAQ